MGNYLFDDTILTRDILLEVGFKPKSNSAFSDVIFDGEGKGNYKILGSVKEDNSTIGLLVCEIFNEEQVIVKRAEHWSNSGVTKKELDDLIKLCDAHCHWFLGKKLTHYEIVDTSKWPKQEWKPLHNLKLSPYEVPHKLK